MRFICPVRVIVALNSAGTYYILSNLDIFGITDGHLPIRGDISTFGDVVFSNCGFKAMTGTTTLQFNSSSNNSTKLNILVIEDCEFEYNTTTASYLMSDRVKQGEYKILMIDRRIHRNGKILGSAGYTDDEGSFISEFSEDERFYTGHEVIDAKVAREISKLEKSMWRVVTKQGDGMVGIHIPPGADITDEKMTKSFKEAFKITKERYPDFDAKTVHCSTWMLDPKLAEILGPDSKITGFINRYLKYPIKSAGKEVFGFVFPREFESYESLPEDTSLQRKLKAMYINGEFIHAHAGFVIRSDEWDT